VEDTYLHDTTRESVGIRTTGSEFFNEQVCLVTLICIEEGDGLKRVMKRRVCEATVTYLDQEQEMSGL
jgi:hypothetical protein